MDFLVIRVVGFYSHCWLYLVWAAIFIVVVAIGFQVILYGNLKK